MTAPIPPATPPATVLVGSVEELIRARLSSALGGWRGSLETALPVIAFVGLWTWRQDIKTAVVGAGIIVVVLAIIRLLQRSSLQFVLSAAFATAIAAFFALRSGKAEDAFLPGIITNVAFGVGTMISNVARWPVIGFLVGAADPHAAEDPLAWRRSPALVRVCQRLTWVLVASYVVRLAVMIPLYLAGNVTALGIAKVVLGWPLWVGTLAVMGALLVRGNTPVDDQSSGVSG